MELQVLLCKKLLARSTRAIVCKAKSHHHSLNFCFLTFTSKICVGVSNRRPLNFIIACLVRMVCKKEITVYTDSGGMSLRSYLLPCQRFIPRHGLSTHDTLGTPRPRGGTRAPALGVRRGERALPLALGVGSCGRTRPIA